MNPQLFLEADGSFWHFGKLGVMATCLKRWFVIK